MVIAAEYRALNVVLGLILLVSGVRGAFAYHRLTKRI